MTFLPDCVGKDTVEYCRAINNGEVVLLENLRFYAEEEGKGLTPEGEKFKPKKEDV